MARTIAQIQSEMDAAYKAAFSLNDTQMSNAGIWKLVRGIVAMAIYSLEKLFDTHKVEVASLAESVEFGNFRWWHTKMGEFQYGDPLLETDGKLYYDVIDEDKQIIAARSIVEDSGVLKIKIAKLTAGELAIIDDADERAAIDSYVLDIKPAGVSTQVISNNADKLRFNIEFVFDGKLIRTDFETAVKTQIKSFLKAIDFDGQFKINRFRDSLESVPGMIDVYVSSASHKGPSDVSYVSISLNAPHNPISGYYKHEEADSTLIFAAQ